MRTKCGSGSLVCFRGAWVEWRYWHCVYCSRTLSSVSGRRNGTFFSGSQKHGAPRSSRFDTFFFLQSVLRLAEAANRGTMLLLLVRALLVSCLVWPLGICCAASPSSNTAAAAAARRSFCAEKTNRHGVIGWRWTTPNGSSGPQQAGLQLERALCVRGGDAGVAVEGQRQKWWKGVNRKPLPAPEALSRCGSEAVVCYSSPSPLIPSLETADAHQCQDP